MRSKLLTKVLASFVGLIALVMFTSIPAEAKKMGSGNSVGKQSNTVTKNQSSLPAKPDAAPVNSAGAAKPAAPAAARSMGLAGVQCWPRTPEWPGMNARPAAHGARHTPCAHARTHSSQPARRRTLRAACGRARYGPSARRTGS